MPLSSSAQRRVIELVITGDSAGAVRALTEAGAASETAAAKLKKTGDAMQTVGRTALGLAAPVIGVGVVAGKMAMNFQQAMEMIHTQAGASQAEVNNLSKSVLNLASSGTMQGPQELAEGLFHLESIGLRGAKAMGVLKIAAQGAAVGGADLTDTVTALGSAVAGGVRGAGDFQHAMGLMNAAVGAGDMHMQDLAQAFGTQLLAAMRTYGLSLKDAGAALAVFGDMNVRGAEAGTRLSQALRVMAAPSDAAAKVMASIGLSATQLGQDIRGPGGLLKALEDLKSHLSDMSKAEQARTLTEMFGGRQAGGVELLLAQLDRFQSKLKRVGEGSSQFGNDVAKTQQTAAYKLHAAWSSVEASLIKLGDSILPFAAAAFGVLAGAVNLLFGAFNVLPGPLKDIIGGFFAFLAVGGGTLLVVGKMVKTWGELKDAWEALKATQLAQTIATRFQSAASTSAVGPASELTAANERLAASYDAVAGSADAAAVSEEAAGAASVTSAAETAAGGGEAAAGGILGRLGIAGMGGMGMLGLGAGMFGLSQLINLGHVKNLTRHQAHHSLASNIRHGNFAAVRQEAWSHSLGFHKPPRHFAQGGPVPQYFDFGGPVGEDTVPAWLEPGEFVLSRPMLQQIMAGAQGPGMGAGNFTIQPGTTNIYIDGRRVAQAVTNYVLSRAARGPSNMVGGSLASAVVGPAYGTPGTAAHPAH